MFIKDQNLKEKEKKLLPYRECVEIIIIRMPAVNKEESHSFFFDRPNE